MAPALSGTTPGAVVRELARLREEEAERGAPSLRTSVMTHLAWVPVEWLEAARATLAGLGERHPSRTILLVPELGAEDGIDAEVRAEHFVPAGTARQVRTEVVELRLRGRTVRAPASVVAPLLLSDLPVFLRWRGPLPYGEPELEQLVDVADRLIVDSREWGDLPRAYLPLTELFERAAVSDIAWARTLPARRALAALWPGIAEIGELGVRGPRAEALLLAGWLRSRLRRKVELAHEQAGELEALAVDGEPVEVPPEDPPRTPSDLLSDELDRLGRDRVYEEAVAAACE